MQVRSPRTAAKLPFMIHSPGVDPASLPSGLTGVGGAASRTAGGRSFSSTRAAGSRPSSGHSPSHGAALVSLPHFQKLASPWKRREGVMGRDGGRGEEGEKGEEGREGREVEEEKKAQTRHFMTF